MKKGEAFSWFKSHKEELILITSGIVIFTGAVLGIKNCIGNGNLGSVGMKSHGDIYSNNWMKRATDNELNVEREKVRQAFCASGTDFDQACRLQNLLWKFDDEMSRRAWGDETPNAPSFHREHGWYLPNDD